MRRPPTTSNGFQIDSDIPVSPHGNRKYAQDFPFSQMKPGDSFFVPATGYKSVLSLQSSLMSSARQHGLKAASRRLKEHGRAGVRIWRVE
jgi:hypothetical protein